MRGRQLASALGMKRTLAAEVEKADGVRSRSLAGRQAREAQAEAQRQQECHEYSSKHRARNCMLGAGQFYRSWRWYLLLLGMQLAAIVLCAASPSTLHRSLHTLPPSGVLLSAGLAARSFGEFLFGDERIASTREATA